MQHLIPPTIASWPAMRGNPFVEILTEGLAEAGVELRTIGKPSHGLISEASALLIQWPDQIFWHAKNPLDLTWRAVREIWGLSRWRRAGKTLIWIVHNNVPHDRSRFERFVWAGYTRVLSSLVHGYMTLSPATQEPVLRVHSSLEGKPFASFRHPAYPGVRRHESAAQAARDKLGVAQSDTLIGAIGMLKAYKGVDDLVRVFKQTTRENWRMLIAGRSGNDAIAAEIEALSAARPDILTDIRELTDDEFATYVAAADRLVAPYKGYLHSGYLVYAVSAGRMILTPSTPFACDIANLVGNGWVNLYEPPLTLEILRKFVNRDVPSEPPDISGLTGQNAGRDIVDFIVRLQGRSKPVTPVLLDRETGSIDLI